MAKTKKNPNTPPATQHLVQTRMFDETKPPPRERHAPKSERAKEIFKKLYPPDGMPSRTEVSDFELERAYHGECDRLGIARVERAKQTQLLRCAGRRK